MEREPSLASRQILRTRRFDALVPRGEIAQPEEAPRQLEPLAHAGNGTERQPRELSPLLQAAAHERETRARRSCDARDHRVTQLAACVKADEAVTRERREAVAQHVGHREARSSSFRHRPRPSGQRGIAFEADDRVLDALGDRARQVAMARADVDDPVGSRRDRQDERPERVDLGTLARRLTRAQPCGCRPWRYERGHRAHLARAHDEPLQGARRALRPRGIESVGL